jgi:hypothetical protein
MDSPIKICFVMLGLVAQLFFFAYVAAEPLGSRNEGCFH